MSSMDTPRSLPPSRGGGPATPSSRSGGDGLGRRDPLTPSSLRSRSYPRGDVQSSLPPSVTDAAKRSGFGRSSQQTPSSHAGISSTTGGARAAGGVATSVPASLHAEALIWGTTVSLQASMATFGTFLRTFRVDPDTGLAISDADAKAAVEEGRELPEPHYLQVLREMVEAGGRVLNLDVGHLAAAGGVLYSQLIKYPQEIVPMFDIVASEEYAEVARALKADAAVATADVSTRAFNLPAANQRRMRELNPVDIDTLVSLQGMVIRTSPLIPDLRQAFFECANAACKAEVRVSVDKGRIEEPATCPECAGKRTMTLVHNRGTYADKQLVKLQEAPDAIPEGETPQTVALYAFDDLCDAVVPGDRVTITGIYRAVPTRPNPRMRTVRSVFKVYLDIVHVAKSERGGGGLSAAAAAAEETERVAAAAARAAAAGGDDDMAGGEPGSEAGGGGGSSQGRGPGPAAGVAPAEGSSTVSTVAAQEMRARVLAMAEEPQLYAKLAHSVAPSVWEHDDVKKGLLLMLLGGVPKELGSEGKIRGEINVLLVGDPGAAKSQLLKYVHERSPRGIYTSGKGSSAVGLTASIVKDPDTREPTLESGALVLSDRGICCIDEFDKMSDSTRSILHEVMEQQTVSIAKAGIVATLNARTSILAAANPIESRYNPRLSVVENIQLPPTLLSRFDLIYLILDPERPEADRKLAEHLISLYQDPALARQRSADTLTAFPIHAFTEYVAYAKAAVRPRLSDEATEAMVTGYVEMRRAGLVGGRKVITATARQLESIIRLSEAHARMRLSPVVEVGDVSEATRLMRVATQTAALDPRTGTINMDLLNTGHREPGSGGQLVDALRESIEISDPSRPLTVDGLLRTLNTGFPVTRQEVETALRQLAGEDAPLIALADEGGRGGGGGRRIARITRLVQ